jgi:ethanolamine utilization protein, EutP
MKKIILMGRSTAGKTTLTQALRGEVIHKDKTQAVQYYSDIIDTPGEYTQVTHLVSALATYAYEADIVGLVIAANEIYSVYPPNITCSVNREVIGIITKIDKEDANVELAKLRLKLTGCKKIFQVNSKEGIGITELLEYLA